MTVDSDNMPTACSMRCERTQLKMEIGKELLSLLNQVIRESEQNKKSCGGWYKSGEEAQVCARIWATPLRTRPLLLVGPCKCQSVDGNHLFSPFMSKKDKDKVKDKDRDIQSFVPDGMVWMGLVIIGHRSFKSTFSANKDIPENSEICWWTINGNDQASIKLSLT